jgi:excisionase family DNA binding protein
MRRSPVRDDAATFSLAIPPGALAAIADAVADRLGSQLEDAPAPYLKIEEAAEYLACPVSRIRDLKDQGRLKHYRDGRRLLFRREDLDAALIVCEPEGR